MGQEETSGFSIVVCTHNGRARLLPTLEHLAALAVPEGCAVELIVVDNASTDGTASFVHTVWQQLGTPYPVAVIEERRPGKGYAVETGYDTAMNAYILTVDDDNWLDAQYLVVAAQLLKSDAGIGVLQGISEGVFEADPPSWVDAFKHLFIIGAPVAKTGYFPDGDFYVWGAGMVLLRADWAYLRGLGFEFLTSKIQGKAAGEDTELGFALFLLGRKFYFSDALKYRHFMPADRVQWQKLQKNFEVFGYVGYYMYLYTEASKCIAQGRHISTRSLRASFFKHWAQLCKVMTVKQAVYYLFIPRKEYYQLLMTDYKYRLKWFVKLSGSASKDISKMTRWMAPVLEKKRNSLQESL